MTTISALKPLPAVTLADMLSVHADLLARLERALPVPDALRHKLVRHEYSPIHLLARLVGPLPASELSHDDDAYGLFRHTIEVTETALVKFHVRPGRPDPANPKAYRRWVRQVVVVFCSALLHDLGKVLFMHVEVVGGKPCKPWTPKRGYLLDYLAEHGATGLAVGWHWGRMRTGFQGHESLAGWLQHLVVLIDLLDEFGVEQANNLQAVLTRSLGKATDGLAELVKDADLEVAMRAMRSEARASNGDQSEEFVPAPGQITPLIDLPPLGAETRAHDFVSMFRAMAKAREIQVNGLQADCFVSATHTIVPIGSPPKSRRGRQASGDIPLMRRVAERIRGRIISDPQAPKAARDAYSICEGHLFLPDFAALSTGSGGWCVLSSPTPLEGYAAIKHYIAIERARGAAYGEMPCIIIRNEVLWGIDDPTKIYNLFVDPIVLWDGASKTQPSVDPEILGFRTVDRPTTVPASTADPHEARAVVAVSFLHRSWQALDRIAPYTQFPTTIREHWQSLAGRLGAPGAVADETLLLSTLEAITDRIEDLMHARQSAATSATAPGPGTAQEPIQPLREDAQNADEDQAPSPTAQLTDTTPLPPRILTPLQKTDLLYRRMAFLATRPVQALPAGNPHHAAAHLLVDDEERCFIAWPAVAVAACRDLGLTEVEASRLLPDVAVRLDAERQDTEHPWLQAWTFQGLSHPPPRRSGFYLVVRRDTIALVVDANDGVGLPVLPCWSVTGGSPLQETSDA